MAMARREDEERHAAEDQTKPHLSLVYGSGHLRDFRRYFEFINLPVQFVSLEESSLGERVGEHIDWVYNSMFTGGESS